MSPKASNVRWVEMFAGVGDRVRRLLLALLLLLSVATGSSQSQVTDPNDSWRVYRDGVHGIAFRYPPALRVVTPSVADAHIEGLVSVVHLVPVDDPRPHPLPILQVHVGVCGEPKAPRVPCPDVAALVASCDKFETFSVGNKRGSQCIRCGSAACHWSAEVVGNGRRVTILTPASDHRANEETSSRSACAERLVANRKRPPLDGILASFMFEGWP